MIALHLDGANGTGDALDTCGGPAAERTMRRKDGRSPTGLSPPSWLQPS